MKQVKCLSTAQTVCCLVTTAGRVHCFGDLNEQWKQLGTAGEIYSARWTATQRQAATQQRRKAELYDTRGTRATNFISGVAVAITTIATAKARATDWRARSTAVRVCMYSYFMYVCVCTLYVRVSILYKCVCVLVQLLNSYHTTFSGNFWRQQLCFEIQQLNGSGELRPHDKIRANEHTQYTQYMQIAYCRLMGANFRHRWAHTRAH